MGQDFHIMKSSNYNSIEDILKKSFYKNILVVCACSIFFYGILIYFHISNNAEKARLHVENIFKINTMAILEAAIQNDQEAIDLIISDINKSNSIAEFKFSKEKSHAQNTFHLNIGEKNLGHINYSIYRSKLIDSESLLLFLFFISLLLIITIASFSRINTIIMRRISNPIKEISNGIENYSLKKSLNINLSDQRPLIEIKNILDTIFDFKRSILNAEVQKSIFEFTKMMAHDVKRPFSRIQSIINLSEDPEVSNGDLRDFLKKSSPTINKDLKLTNNLILNVLECSSSIKLSITEISLKDLIEDVIEETKIIENLNNITLKFEWGHESKICADQIQISRVITNIFENAIQAIKPSGEVIFSTCETDKIIELHIQNNGPKIPSSELKKIFDFSFTTKKKGSGIGLTISKKIMEYHGQNLSVFSQEDHTRFSLSFKRSPFKEVSRHQVSDISTSTDEKISILSIDDEDFYHQGLQLLVNSSKDFKDYIEIFSCFSSHEVDTFFKTKKFTPDIILCDIELGPKSENGISIIKNIRKLGVKSKIHVVTNNISKSLNIETLKAGADSYWPKPLNKAHLRKILKAN